MREGDSRRGEWGGAGQGSRAGQGIWVPSVGGLSGFGILACIRFKSCAFGV